MKVLIDGINYELDCTSRTASVCALDNGKYSGDIVIPAKITYDNTLYHITSIYGQFMGGAFYDCSSLTSITIPDSVTSIGESAFYDCSSLTSITIPDSVTSIGEWAFSDCSGLVSVIVEQGNQKYDSRDNCNAIIETKTNTLIVGCQNTIIPDSVTSIGNSAFSGCKSLTSITIPNSVTSIGNSAFSSCKSLTSITIPDSVMSIGEWAFSSCKSLTSITIPDSVMSIGEWAFSDCSGLVSVIVEQGNQKYDSRDNCNAIIETKTNTLIVGCQNTIIPDSVTSIGNSAFSGCKSLTSITIPNSVTSIGKFAFSDCSSLTSITIPDSVTSIGESAFSDCSGLVSVIVEQGNQKYDSRDNCNAIIETKTNTLIVGCQNTIIPDSVTSIGDWAFDGCSGLTSVTIPDSVTSIGECAFIHCSGLTSITIPDSVTSIGKSAFCDCRSLTSITIPNSAISIGDWAFDDTPWLNNQPDGIVYINNILYEYKGKMPQNTNIVVRQGTLSISDSAFEYCSSLTSITIPDSATSIGKSAFCGCRSLTSITIPNSVTSIGESAFNDTPWLNNQSDGIVYINNILYEYKGKMSQNTNIVVRQGTLSISDSAFEYCSSLTSITIPDSVTSIGKSAFCGCRSLTSITIPDSVTSIGDRAFQDCSSLTSITIPKNVVSIGECVLCRCNAQLVSVVVDKENKKYHSSDNCQAIIETATGALIVGCKNTQIPNNVKCINKGAFCHCRNLASIVIPNSVVQIGEMSFRDCIGLISVTIPNSVTSIAKGAFKDCRNLTSIRIQKGKQSIFDKDDLEDLQDKFVEYISAQIDGVQYELDDDLTAVVCALVCAGEKSGVESVEESREKAYMGSVVIPARVEQDGKKYTVNRLAARTFADCEELTAVTLPKSITEIGAEIFSGCENLQTIRVPQGMTEQFCEMGLGPWRDKIVEPRQEEYTILLNIARGYEQGIGMPRNPAQAVLLYSQAADKGCADAAYHLGELYEEGLLLPQDYQQAADWFGKAAALYHPNAATRRQACLRIIEEENARLTEMQQEQQAQLDRLAQTQTINNNHTPMKTILFFDTETNGLPRDYKAGVTNTANWPRMIQLGWIITDEEGKVLKQESRLIYPDFVINEAVTRLTGITTEQARREGTDISEVLPEFMEDVENASLLVGHNIDFDRHIVGCEIVRMQGDPRTLMTKPAVCTMQRSTNFCAIPSKSSYHTGYKYPTLTELYTKLFGHAFSGAHDALADITATKECYFELRKRGVISMKNA